jgi:hypothetical protein
MASIETLPAEISAEISDLVHLSSTASLHACLFVSKAWYQKARPVLNSTIILSLPEAIVKFCEQFNFADHGILVRSLTFRPTPHPSAWGVYSEDVGDYIYKASTSELINRLAGVVGRLSQLRTLSVFVPRNVDPIEVISPASLAALVDALPESCDNLEIDTQGHASVPVAADEPHLCERLRYVLPRLRHFRLRMGRMCSALLGKGPSSLGR